MVCGIYLFFTDPTTNYRLYMYANVFAPSGVIVDPTPYLELPPG